MERFFGLLPIIKENKYLLIGTSFFLGFSYLFRKFINGPKCNTNANDLKNKVVIITGANAGIGLETAKLILEKGAKVIFACRDEKRTLESIQKNIPDKFHCMTYVIKCDISNFESILNFVNEFGKKFENFDILINNAGGMFNKFQKSSSGMEMTLETNHFGGMYLSMLLSERINPRGRIINVGSSIMKNFEFKIDGFRNDLDFIEKEKNWNFVKQYSISKQMQFAFSNFLSSNFFKNKYPKLSFKSVCLHPGVILTDAQTKFKGFWINFLIYLIKPIWFFFTKSLFYGAQTTLYCALQDYDMLQEAKFYSDCELKNLPKFLEDDKYIKDLLNYNYDLMDKFHSITNLPKQPKEILGIMKTYFQE